MGGDETRHGRAAADDVVHLRRRTVICSRDVGTEKNPRSAEELLALVEEEVKAFVDAAVRELNKGRRDRWCDPDFGPSKADPRGAQALYRNAREAVPGYPKPDELRWARPGYARARGGKEEQEEQEEQDVYCRDAALFKGKVQSSSVTQGKLGDCWFLSAVAIAAARPSLIKACFWRLDDYKDYGLFVVRFFKNGAWYFVVIDDRIPLFDCSNGQPCFARTQDSSELWLPLLEKAYAKLHFSYDSLASGHTEVALREITGLCSERVAVAPATSRPAGGPESPDLWARVRETLDFGLVAGCVVQPEDGPAMPDRTLTAAGKPGEWFQPRDNPHLFTNSSVIPSSVRGLEKRHAYVLKACKVVGGARIVMLRNPWGFGSWLGPWSRGSPEYKKHAADLALVFPADLLDDQACFLMSWADFEASFTSVFATIEAQGPGNDQASRWRGGFFSTEQWTEQSAGGGVDKETWFLNPRLRLRVTSAQTRIFAQVYLHDRRMQNSQHRNGTLYAFSICGVDGAGSASPQRPVLGQPIPGSNPTSAQPVYTFSPSCSKDVTLSPGEYMLVPHTFDRGQLDNFSVFVFYDKPVSVQNALPMQSHRAALGAGAEPRFFGAPEAWAAASSGGDEALPVADVQAGVIAEDPAAASDQKARAQRAEAIKEKLLAVAKSRGISSRRVIAAFPGSAVVDRLDFKQRMVSLGFNVSEIPDKEFALLAYPDAAIASNKIRSVFEQDLLKQSLLESKKPEPVDDLLFRPPAAAAGQLMVTTSRGQDLVYPAGAAARRHAVFRSELRRRRLQVVATSPVLTFSSRTVIVRVWQVVARPTAPCVPIAFDVNNCMEYGFTELTSVQVEEHQMQQASFWEETFERWCSTESLAFDPIDSQPDIKNCYVPHRLSYVSTVLRQQDIQLQLAPGAPSSEENGELTPDETTFLSGVAGKQQPGGGQASAATTMDANLLRLHNVFDEVLDKVNSTATAVQLDRARNEQFFKMKELKREKRREVARAVSRGDQAPLELSERERVRPSETIPKASSPSNTDKPPASAVPEAVDEPLYAALRQLVEGHIMTQTAKVLFVGRESIAAGAWREELDRIEEREKSGAAPPETTAAPAALPVFDASGARLVYSCVLAIPGEALVKEEKLARATDIASWFKKFDRDANGKIDRFEFRRALQSLGLELGEAETRNLIIHLDKDGDGAIDPSEFSAFVEADKDMSVLQNDFVPIEQLLEALASPSINKAALTDAWSLGRDWFKLRNFAAQLRDLTKTCRLKMHRTIFALDARVAVQRVYRISHMFEEAAHFSAFLARAQAAAASFGGDAGLPENTVQVDEPDEARRVLVELLTTIQGIGKLNAQRISEQEIDLDKVMAALPALLQDILGRPVDLQGGVRADDFSEAVLRAHARREVADKMAGDLAALRAEASLSATEVTEKEAAMQAEMYKSFSTALVPLREEGSGRVQLTLAEQVRLLVDDGLVFCKAKRVNRSALARMLNPDLVLEVERKLRHRLRQQESVREGPVSYLVDVFATDPPAWDMRKPDPEALEKPPMLRVRAVNPENGATLELNDVAISKEEQATLPPRNARWFAGGRVVTKASSHGPRELWMPHSHRREARHFLEDLMARLVICKSAQSTGERLALSVEECAEKVDFVRETLDSCSKLSFYYQVSKTHVRFLVDGVKGQACKHRVLEALRKQQGNRVARSLSTLHSVLTVVFEETHGDFREVVTWGEFTAYLQELRNCVVEVKVRPTGSCFSTGVAHDGGFNPSFHSDVQAAYRPQGTANRSLVQTRVSKIADKHYVILFVYHLPERRDRYGVVAYDPRTNDEFSLRMKQRVVPKRVTVVGGVHLRRRQTTVPVPPPPGAGLQYWGSPKKRRRPGFSASSIHPSHKDGELTAEEKRRAHEARYEAETLRVLDKHAVFQDAADAALELGLAFPLQDDKAWEEVLEHAELGACLTPHVEFAAYNCIEGEENCATNCIGTAAFPLAVVTNCPGKQLERWVSFRNSDGMECGKLQVSLRFDDAPAAAAAIKSADATTRATEPDVFAQAADGAGDESAPPQPETATPPAAAVGRHASTARDYGRLAQSLREEVLETKLKLSESERARHALEETIQQKEERLRATRAEILHHRRKLDEAEQLAKSSEPRPPRSGATLRDVEEYNRLKRVHEAKVRELDILKEENEKLRTLTDAKDVRISQDVRELRKQLEEAETRLRTEVASKQELLARVEDANVKAQSSLAQSAQLSATRADMAALRKGSGRSRAERDSDRERRAAWLEDRLGNEYRTYKAELEGCLGHVVAQLAKRRPDKPSQPLDALEHLLIANSKANQPQLMVAADVFQEVLLNFGLNVRPADTELLITHYDTAGDNHVAVEDLMDGLRDGLRGMPEPRVATRGFRGVQSVQRRSHSPHKPW